MFSTITVGSLLAAVVFTVTVISICGRTYEGRLTVKG